MYVIIWKFVVKPGAESDFVRAYGPEGAWAQFFRRGHGYLGTDLLRDVKPPPRYFTLDRWESREAFENFQAKFVAGYQVLDDQCEALTESEEKIGCFEWVGAQEVHDEQL